MSAIPRLFTIVRSTTLKPVIGGTSPVLSNAQAIPNDNPIYVIQLSLFACLFISLFLILITLTLAFILFLYTQGARQSISRQELVGVVRPRKQLKRLMRSYCSKKRNRHCLHSHPHYIDQSLTSHHKQGCSGSSAMTPQSSVLQTRDQATQCNDGSIYQLQPSTGPTPFAVSSCSANSSTKASLSAKPSLSAKSSFSAKPLSAKPLLLSAKPSFSTGPSLSATSPSANSTANPSFSAKPLSSEKSSRSLNSSCAQTPDDTDTKHWVCHVTIHNDGRRHMNISMRNVNHIGYVTV